MNTLTGFFILGCVGMALEVFYTGIMDYLKGETHNALPGRSYVWMFPAYGFLSLFFPYVQEYVWYARGIIYVIGVFVFEYIYGFFLRMLLGAAPWEHKYHGKKWSVHGLVRLDYAIHWFVALLLLEVLWRSLGA